MTQTTKGTRSLTPAICGLVGESLRAKACLRHWSQILTEHGHQASMAVSWSSVWIPSLHVWTTPIMVRELRFVYRARPNSSTSVIVEAAWTELIQLYSLLQNQHRKPWLSRLWNVLAQSVGTPMLLEFMLGASPGRPHPWRKPALLRHPTVLLSALLGTSVRAGVEFPSQVV